MRLFARRPATPDAGDSMDRWIAVGLTNPEGEYGGTRHNIGADVVRHLAARQHVDLRPHKAQALVADTMLGVGADAVPLTLAVPFGYMNNSGGPVQQLLRFYKVPPTRLIVVCDELDLEPGVIRVKQGGTGGHNGLKDIKQKLSSEDYLRVRFGIGRPPGRMPTAAYVLQRFPTKERADVIDVAVARAADAVETLIHHELADAQNRIHAG